MVRVLFVFPCGTTKKFLLSATIRGLRVGGSRAISTLIYDDGKYPQYIINEHQAVESIVKSILPALHSPTGSIEITDGVLRLFSSTHEKFLRSYCG